MYIEHPSPPEPGPAQYGPPQYDQQQYGSPQYGPQHYGPPQYGAPGAPGGSGAVPNWQSGGPYQVPPLLLVPPGHQALATPGDRLLARLIDGAIVFCFEMIIGLMTALISYLLLWKQMNASLPEEPTDSDLAAWVATYFGAFFTICLVFVILMVAAGYTYEVWLPRNTGQTIGKRVMSLRVVPLSGEPMRQSILARRWVGGQLLASCLPMYSLLDSLWLLWDRPYQQCLHDKFSGTTVVKCGPPPQTVNAWQTGQQRAGQQ